MNKGLRIKYSVPKLPKQFLRNIIQKKALQLELQGIAQLIKDESALRICVYGYKEKVDSFIDFLHNEPGNVSFKELEIEPCLTQQDYHGVFRIVE